MERVLGYKPQGMKQGDPGGSECRRHHRRDGEKGDGGCSLGADTSGAGCNLGRFVTLSSLLSIPEAQMFLTCCLAYCENGFYLLHFH